MTMERKSTNIKGNTEEGKKEDEDRQWDFSSVCLNMLVRLLIAITNVFPILSSFP